MNLDSFKYKNFWFLLGLILLVISISLNIFYRNENILLEQLNKQKQLALKEELKKIELEKNIIYRKYLDVQRNLLLKDLDLKESKNKIIYLSKLNLHFKAIIDSGFGSVDTSDEKKLFFNKETELYSYDLLVIANNPPFHNLNFRLNAIKNLIFNLSLDSSNNFITNLILPKIYDGFLSIDNFETKIDEKIYKYILSGINNSNLDNLIQEQQNIFNDIKVLTGINFSKIEDKYYFSLGGGIIFNDNGFSYYKGINNNHHYFNYNRLFSLKSIFNKE